jgi:protein-disulfide isomerase
MRTRKLLFCVAAFSALALNAACSRKLPSSNAAATAAANPANDSVLAVADQARIRGSDSAAIWMVMASDFQCPYCRQFHEETYPQLYRDYVSTGKVKVAYLNFPMPAHQFGVVSAEAGMCAATQQKFWPMHDALFASQDSWVQTSNPRPVFDSLATTIGLNTSQWKSCMDSHLTLPLIESDRARLTADGVDGTPSFFIGNKLAVSGAQPYEQFKAALDSALAHAAAGGSVTPS